MEGHDKIHLPKEELVVERDCPGLEICDGNTDGITEKEIEAEIVKTSKECIKETVSVVPEVRNTVEKNVSGLAVESSHLLVETDLDEKEDSRDESCECSVNSKSQNFVFYPSWSESLKSPIGVSEFSPSENRSSHGLGLQLAVERNFSTALFLGNVSVFLSSIATLYDLLGVNLGKTAQNVRSQRLPPEIPIRDDLISLCENISSLGSCFRSSAESYRASIIADLKKTLSTNGTERDAAIKRYREVKQGSAEARKLARTKYSSCKNATIAAEVEIESWLSKLHQKERRRFDDHIETEETIHSLESESSWEKALNLAGKDKVEEEATIRLIKKLKSVELCRAQYIESIEKENHCVGLSEEMEVLALSEAQKLEENQTIYFLQEILSQVFPKNKNSGDLLVTESTISIGEIDRPFAEGFEKKGIELLSSLNLFKQQTIPYEDGMGVMDADTLGLPEALGVQRDKIKSSFSARENRIETTEIVVKLFEEIADVTLKYSLRMKSQIANERKINVSEGSSSEQFFRSIWQSAMSVYEDEEKLISKMVFPISELEKWLSSSKRILENAIESDDISWKRLCDAARAEMKFESRYKQTIQQAQKVRQRASSKELSSPRRESNDSSEDILQPQRNRNDSSASIGTVNRSISGTQSTPNRGVRAFFKGGEAMKKLKENAMVQIAQMSMNEVDQKGAKDKLALEEATAERIKALNFYASTTKDRINEIDAEDQSGWVEMKEIILKLTEVINSLKKARFTKLQRSISCEIDNAFELLIARMDEWPKSIQEKIYQTERASSSLHSTEYALSIEYVTSNNIDQLLGMTDIDLKLPLFQIEVESIEQPESPSATTMLSGTNVEGNSSREKYEKSQKLSDASSSEIAHDSEVEKGKTSENTSDDPGIVADDEASLEVRAFVEQFWSDKPKDQKVPNIIDTFTCAYRPKERMGFLAPNLHGRIYITTKAIYFLAAENNFTLHWEKVISIAKEKGFMGSINANDLVISYRSGNSTSSFLLCRVKDRDNVVANLQRLKVENEESEASMDTGNCSEIKSQLPEVPPDLLLKDMEIVVSRTIKNVSIESIFERVWADRVEDISFYESWLKDEECFDIVMGKWEVAKTGDGYRNEWCNEKYDQQRFVKFKFNRTTHLYIGPPVAIVKQRHFLRVEKGDKCVLAISAEFEGIPYADTFAVEMRWVASRVGSDDAFIQVGLFVNFKKNTMLKSQIKSGTITETKNVHLRLFEAVKRTCTSSQDSESDDEDKNEDQNEEIGSNKAKKDSFVTLGSFFNSHNYPPMNSVFASLYAHMPAVRSFFGSLNASTIAISIGIAALLLTGRHFTQVNTRPSNMQQVENLVTELQQEIHDLHESIDSITLVLQDIKSSCSFIATHNSDTYNSCNNQLDHAGHRAVSEINPESCNNSDDEFDTGNKLV